MNLEGKDYFLIFFAGAVYALEILIKIDTELTKAKLYHFKNKFLIMEQ